MSFHNDFCSSSQEWTVPFFAVDCNFVAVNCKTHKLTSGFAVDVGPTCKPLHACCVTARVKARCVVFFHVCCVLLASQHPLVGAASLVTVDASPVATQQALRLRLSCWTCTRHTSTCRRCDRTTLGHATGPSRPPCDPAPADACPRTSQALGPVPVISRSRHNNTSTMAPLRSRGACAIGPRQPAQRQQPYLELTR